MNPVLHEPEFAQLWDPAFAGPTVGSTVVDLNLSSREAADDTYARVVGAGYANSVEPWDTFFGARYAMVCDHAIPTPIPTRPLYFGPYAVLDIRGAATASDRSEIPKTPPEQARQSFRAPQGPPPSPTHGHEVTKPYAQNSGAFQRGI